MRIIQHFRSQTGFVVLATCAYVLLLGWGCQTKFAAFGYGDFDFAVHAQSVWNILHGSLDSSILGIPFLGNHMVLILFLIAPLYALFATPLVLLHIQTVALGIGAIGIFKLAEKELPRTLAVWISLIYLVYPPLIYLNLFEFHPIALAVPLLIWMLYFYRISRFMPFLACLVLSLMCQENVSLMAIAFSFYVLLDGRRGKWLWTPLLLGALYFWLAVLVAMPQFNGNTIQFTKLYGQPGNSLPEVLKNMALHPLATVSSMLAIEKLIFLSALLAPLAYLSLLSPSALIPILPVLAQRLLSVRLSEFSIVYHYQAEFIPFLFFAAILGTKRVLCTKNPLASRGLLVVLVLLPAIAFLTSGVLPTLGSTLFPSMERLSRSALKTEIIGRVPPSASVLCTFDFLPKLANRKELYSFHHVYSGKYTLSDVAYLTPQVDAIILDTNDPLTFSQRGFYGKDNYTRIRDLLASGNWQLAEHVDSLLMFQKIAGTNIPSAALAVAAGDSIQMNREVRQVNSADIQLIGFNLGPADAYGRVPLTLYWQKLRDSDKDYDMYLTLAYGKYVACHEMLSPGTRIWPPQSWPSDRIIADKHRLSLSGGDELHAGTPHVQVELIPLN